MISTFQKGEVGSFTSGVLYYNLNDCSLLSSLPSLKKFGLFVHYSASISKKDNLKKSDDTIHRQSTYGLPGVLKAHRKHRNSKPNSTSSLVLLAGAVFPGPAPWLIDLIGFTRKPDGVFIDVGARAASSAGELRVLEGRVGAKCVCVSSLLPFRERARCSLRKRKTQRHKLVLLARLPSHPPPLFCHWRC